jgi:hypothetical protein
MKIILHPYNLFYIKSYVVHIGRPKVYFMCYFCISHYGIRYCRKDRICPVNCEIGKFLNEEMYENL